MTGKCIIRVASTSMRAPAVGSAGTGLAEDKTDMEVATINKLNPK